MTRMVCLGDSFTEGLSDGLRPDGRHRGWSDRVAEGLATAGHPRFPGPIEYANLAVRGKLLRQAATEQVPAALAMSPDLITFQAGPNDVLRPRADVADLTRRYTEAVDRLRADGATVVLFTSVARTGGSGFVANRIADRMAEFNDGVRATAERQACPLVDNASIDALTDRRLWAADRLHLNEDGHRRVAGHVLWVLGVTDPQLLGGPVGWWTDPLPPARRSQRADLVADAEWMGRHVAPWVGRRLRGVSSGDGVPPKDPLPRRIGVLKPATSDPSGR